MLESVVDETAKNDTTRPQNAIDTAVVVVGGTAGGENPEAIVGDGGNVKN